MTLADARAAIPTLAVAEADPPADAEDLSRLADWCGRWTPWTATDGADGIVLDVSGCAHLFGGELGQLLDQVRPVVGDRKARVVAKAVHCADVETALAQVVKQHTVGARGKAVSVGENDLCHAL